MVLRVLCNGRQQNSLVFSIKMYAIDGDDPPHVDISKDESVKGDEVVFELV